MSLRKPDLLISDGFLGSFECQENREALRCFPPKEKIKDRWGAAHYTFGKPEAYRIGPIIRVKRNESTRFVPFLEKTIIAVESYQALEKLAENSGLRVIKTGGFIDADSGLEMEEQYRFEKLEQKA